MAKAKKKETLTPEERLQAALVPDWEQPYKVPKNWCWVRFSKIINLISGRDAKLTDCNSLGIGIPYILGASNLENNVFTIERWIENPQVISLKNDVLLSVKGTIGKVYLQKEEKVNISRQIMAIRTSSTLFPRFTYWLVNNISDSFRQAGNGLIPGISREDILQKEVPFPPLPEQQRIVDRIESLFAKLDEAKQKTQEALNSYETRKAAILHKAFTGELTARWRKEHGLGMESWEKYKFNDILDVRDGTHDSPTYFDQGFPLITSKNLKDGKITDKDLKFISKEDYDKINERSKVDIGDILFAMIGTIGNPVVVETQPKFAIKNVALFKNIGKASPYFVKYFLESKKVIDRMEKDAKGSTQKFVSLGYLRAFNILLPKSKEQTEIVRILDDLLAKEQQAKEAAEAVLDQIDLMKKSILARAFRGELGTNNPAEESAVELVKNIIS
ncbi:type I restriction modification DNA specificity domain protein [[Clostridium] leptum DSM 753]|uniref:Type I restriction modification DNA specificity domain protein n=1 Tax=[Clostridium] leptum DSM 753 TaxID=428125 RepID=A7VYZ3_9FIRM|nr:type I restriction modification DNA specificity domain protein [[Clostridium] leptum DSM 753]MCC3320827.1 restriction endonuclease subunit S [[Clostridium] innocuum]PEQ25297.1 hypothetical protein CH238_04520 [[Clostridium] leptum DSM 753]